MSHFSYQIIDDSHTLTKQAAEIIAEKCQQAISERGKFYLALSGGSTPKVLYQYLAEHYSDLPWDKVEIFFGDERCVAPDDEQSNYLMAHTAMFDRLSIPAENIHRIKGELEPEQAVADYQQALCELPQSSIGWPVFDLVLLGMGPDGHTASLFPESKLINESNVPVAADHIEKMGNWRITLTFPVINAARDRLVLAGGVEKAPVIKNLMQSDWPDTQYPIARLTPEHTQWLLLPDAASTL